MQSAQSEPEVIREKKEWVQIWQPDSDQARLTIPRVLLIGDSITLGYGGLVDKLLAERASISRLATSRFVADPVFRDELALVLSRTQFDVIHFNNGLHGFDNSESQYAEFLARILDEIGEMQPTAKLILVTSTPKRDPDNLDAFHAHADQIQRRNQILCAAAAERGLPVNDLYALVLDHPEYYVPDATHFNETGRQAQAEAVAQVIGAIL